MTNAAVTRAMSREEELADWDRRLDNLAERLKPLARRLARSRIPQTFAEELEWEREFGAENRAAEWSWHQRPGFWRELWKHSARRYGMTYEAVKAAYLNVWQARP